MKHDKRTTNYLLLSKLLVLHCQLNTFLSKSISRNWTIPQKKINWRLGSLMWENNQFCGLAQNAAGHDKLWSLVIDNQ